MLTVENKRFIESIAMHWLLRNVVFSQDIAEFIGCQFALESDFGNSRLAKVSHNFCGMKPAFRRVSYRIYGKEDNGFAVFDSLDNCVMDYVSWVFYNRPNKNELTFLDSFVIFLRNSGYCPEKDYISKIQSIYQQFKNYKNE